jgi:hypothetical protein
MTPDDLQREYQKQANLANTIGLSVPVALQLQTVVLLEQILAIVSRPPMIVEQTPSSLEVKLNPARAAAPAPVKKDSRP